MTPEQFNARALELRALTPRHVTQLVRAWQKENSLLVDGKAGPQTLNALNAERFGEDTSRVRRVTLGPWDGPLEHIPRNRREVYQVFGDPGTGKPDKAWVKANIVTVSGLAGYAGKVQLHRKAEPYVREAFRRAVHLCPTWKATRVGGWVFRHQRHDPARPLSMHAFGCAVDVDPHLNAARTFTADQPCPERWTPAWMAIWPRGLPEGVVEAFTSCGFANGADWNQDGLTSDHVFSDPQHHELVRRG